MAMMTRRTKMWEFPGPTPHSVAIVAKPPRKNPVDGIVLESRRRAKIEADKMAIDDENNKITIRSEWERKSEKRITGARLKREVGVLMKCEEFQINDRREKLRAVLQKEDEAYIEEMLSKEETVLERQAKMRERARQLKEKREQERLELVQQKYDQQFLQDCEELRLTISKRNQDEMCVNRVEQLRQKEQKRQEDEKLDEIYNDMWRKDMEEKARKEEQNVMERIARDKDVLSTLQTQMAALDEQKKKEKELKEDDAKLMEEQRALLNMEELRKREYKAQKQAEMREMLDRSVGLKNRLHVRRQQEELAFDLQQLEKLLQDTKDDEIWKRTRKAELREEDRKYRDYLKYMLDVERLKEKELNDLTQAEVDRSNAKKLAKVREEREARRRLLSEVLATRAEQLQQRMRENAQKKEEAMRDRQAMEKSIEENRMREMAEQEENFIKKMDYGRDLNGQMQYNYVLRDEEHRQEADELEATQRAEEEYQQKVIDILNSPHPQKQHPMASAVMRRYAESQQVSG